MRSSLYEAEMDHKCPRCGKKLRDHQVLFIVGGAVALGKNVGPDKGMVCATSLTYPITDSIRLSWLLGG